MEGGKEDAYICPSFSSYSSDRLAEVAGKVATENEDANDDDEFEFALVRQDTDFLSQKFFYEGQIGKVFPVFCRDLLLDDVDELCTSGENERCESSSEVEGIKVPLSKLLMEDNRCGEINERDLPSCSSSEADELESIPAGTYCVWRPKVAETPSIPSQCKKSKSTGSASKRWKLPEFLRRSNSEGKDYSVFLTPKHREGKPDQKIETPTKLKKGKKIVGGSTSSPSAHESLYILNRATTEGNRKKSYLPYRRDLVGFFSNVNGLGKNLAHF